MRRAKATSVLLLLTGMLGSSALATWGPVAFAQPAPAPVPSAMPPPVPDSARGTAAEPDHVIHQQLRKVVQDAQVAIETGKFEDLLPLLTEDFEGTTLTQDAVRGRQGVEDYYKLWFGPGGYMKSMTIELKADSLTDLSEDKTWGIVRGTAAEHYVAKNGDMFDFDTRWTTVMVLDTDGKWRVRAIHFGTNHLDNPVLWKVRNSILTYGAIFGLLLTIVTFGAGFFVGTRRSP